jgi:hypothetical protein
MKAVQWVLGLDDQRVNSVNTKIGESLHLFNSPCNCADTVFILKVSNGNTQLNPWKHLFHQVASTLTLPARDDTCRD